MKIVGITLMWVGGLYLLQNLGIIRIIDWNVIWPVALIILGVSIKRMNHGMLCCVGGKCGVCKVGDEHKCEGEGCGTCKVK